MRPRDILLILLVILVWGLNFVVAKFGLQEFPPLFMMALRFAVLALVLIFFVRRPTGMMRQIILLSVTLGSLHFSLMFVGLSGVTASVASIAIQLQVPFSAILAAALFNDLLGWRRALGMVLAFIGVVIVAGEPEAGTDLVHLAMIVAASFVWAIGNVQVKGLARIDGMTLNAWISVFSAPQLLLASLLLESGQLDALASASWRGWGAVAYMVVMVNIVGYGLWYRMLDSYQMNQTMPFTLLVPVVGVLSGVLVLGDPMTWQIAAGGLATVVGVGIIVLRRPRLAGPEV